MLGLAAFLARSRGAAGRRQRVSGAGHVSPAPVFLGVGAVAGQLAATRRLALELSLAVLALAFGLG